MNRDHFHGGAISGAIAVDFSRIANGHSCHYHVDFVDEEMDIDTIGAAGVTQPSHPINLGFLDADDFQDGVVAVQLDEH